MKNIILPIILLISSNFVSGQLANFNWEDEICSYESKFDSTVYSRKQIENSYEFAFHNYKFDNIAFHVFEPEHIERIDLELFEREHNHNIEELESLIFVEGQVWDSLRTIHRKEIDLSYKLLKMKYLMHLDSIPAELNTYFPEDKNVVYYANALINGGEYLLQAWDKLTMEYLPKNINPDKKLKEYQQQLSSSDRFEYARIEVLNFGWWNSVNKHIHHVKFYSLQVSFKEIFESSSSLNCDEP